MAPNPEQVPTFVGLFTTAAGVALLTKPKSFVKLTGVEDTRALQVIGAADLVLVPGLLAGQTKWPWMVARAVLNVAMISYLKRLPGRPKVIAGALATVSVADVATAVQLKQLDR